MMMAASIKTSRAAKICCKNKVISDQISRQMSQKVFRSSINPTTGQSEWIMENEDFDFHQEIARSAYADMLHDTERNKKYEIGLKMAIETMHNLGKKANVLDIGTGTGLLSMMACRNGADTVTACEAFSPMADCAKKVIAANGFGDKIKLIPKRSTDIQVGPGGDMPSRANILVTEVFDTELIGEGGIYTFNHAHDNLLEKGSIVVPSRSTMYAQPVYSEFISNWNEIKEIKVGDKMIKIPSNVTNCTGAAAVHDIQLDQIPKSLFTPLCEPVPIFKFDFTGEKRIPVNDSSEKKVTALTDGTCHGIFMWWDIDMDMNGECLLSCAPRWGHPEPDKMPWRDHWMQAVYYPKSPVSVKKGQEFTLLGCHDEYSLWFDIGTSKENSIEKERPICTCGTHIALSRSRIRMLNNQKKWDLYTNELLKVIKEDTVCVTLSDASYLPIIAAFVGCSQVICVEPNPMTRRTVENLVKENKLEDKIRIVESTESLSSLKKIDLIIGEPFFISSILPWHNIYLWYTRWSLDNQLNIKIIPSRFRINLVAMEFKDLWKIRAPVVNCEGFDLKIFDDLIQGSSDLVDSDIEPQPLWEYPGRSLSEICTAIEFDINEPPSKESEVIKVGIKCDGELNGVALWTDYKISEDSDWLSTGSQSNLKIGENPDWDHAHRQGVHLLKIPKNVTAKSCLECAIEFKPENGQFSFTFHV